MSLPQAAPERSRRLGIYACAAALFFYAASLLWSLGVLPLMGPDEPRYAQVAREMFSRGDFISPRLSGLLWFEKPVLFYWAAASSYTIFGVSEFAARLPSALAALISVGAVGFACWRLGLKKLGAISALVLATSAIWIGFSRAATTDMLLASSLCVAIVAGFLAGYDRTSPRARLGWIFISASAVGLAMLAKGLIGVALTVAILGIHGAITRRWVFRSAPQVLGAVLVFALVAGLWYLPVTLKHGSLFIDEFFINHHFKRYLTNKYNHPKPFYYYAIVTFGGSVPWSFFLFPALARLRTLRPRENARDSLLCLAWVWAFVPIAFFSLSTSKLAGYILPAFPALAIILGLEAERLWSGEKTRLLHAAGVLNTLAIAIAMGVGVSYLRKKGFSMQGWETVVFGVPLALGLATMVAVLLGRVRAAIVGPPAILMSAVVLVLGCLAPNSGDMLSAKPFALEVASRLKPEEDLIFYRSNRQYAHLFYSKGRVVFYNKGRPIQRMSSGDDVGLESRDELALALEQERAGGESSVVVLTPREWQREVESDKRFGSEVLARQEKTTALRVWLQPRSS